MTTTQLQLRRDTTANIDAITPAQGEPIYDVTRKALVLGDGATLGGDCVTPFSGTWTPTLLGSTTAGSPTYSAQVGTYICIGPLVIAFFAVTISAIGGMTGALLIGGLPVEVAGPGINPLAGIIDTVSGITLDSGYTQIGIGPLEGGFTAELIENGSNKTSNQIAIGNVAAATVLTGVLIYQAAQPTG